MRVRCAYCKGEFTLEALKTSCPSCGRVAILPRNTRPKAAVRGGRRDQAGKQSVQMQGFAGFLLFAQQPVFLLALVIVSVVGLVIYVTAVSPAGGGKYPMQVISKRPENVAAREVAVLRIALANFMQDCKRYPDQSEGLVALLNNPGVSGWNGPYLTLLRPDPWGKSYIYRVGTNESGYALLSAGPDGTDGTADDINPGPLSEKALDGAP